MRARFAALLTLAGLGGVLVLGCDTPSEPELQVDVEPAFARAGGAPLANGSGIQVRAPGAARAFTFTVNGAADGSVQGQLQLSIGMGFRIHVEVTCATAVGNRAWIGGVIRSSSAGEGDLFWLPGQKVGTLVEDNGRGGGSADRIAFVNTSGVDQTFDARVCDRDPSIGLDGQLFAVRGDLRVYR